MRVIEFSRKKSASRPKAESDAIIKAKRKEDDKLVKGVFEFPEAEGGFFRFNYRIYPGEAIRTFELIHGETCEIPMGLVKHLNGIKKKIRRYKDVEQAQSGPLKTPRTYETLSRVRFIPSDFI